MFKRVLLLSLIGAWLAAPVGAQDLDEVLGHYYDAIGGLDTWKAVKTMKASGTLMMGDVGIEAPFSVVGMRPNRVRIEFTVQGMTGIQAFDGETAWMLMPFMGRTEAEPMPEGMAKEVREQGDMDGPLVDYAAKGHQVELVGREEVEGKQAFKLKLTRKSGGIEFYYLDAEHFIPIKVEGSREVNGRIVEFERRLSDYKEVHGLMIPHVIEEKPKGAPAGQVLTIEAVEVNIPVEESLFRIPEKEGENQQ